MMDTNCIVHDLSAGWETYKSLYKDRDDSEVATERTRWVRLQMDYISSGHWLGVMQRPQFNIVWALDDLNKQYWRMDWLAQDSVTAQLPIPTRGKNKGKQLPIAYKGGRRKLGNDHYSIKEQVINYIGYHKILYLQRYEADDIIAGLCQRNNILNGMVDILIATIDSDLLGLVNRFVGWGCVGWHKPRLRLNLEQINLWRVNIKKLNPLDVPSQLWHHKAYTEGDKSDNLPPTTSGCTLPAIDLLNPPDEHKLWLQPEFIKIADKCIVDALNTNIRCYNEGSSVKELRESGYIPQIKPYTLEELNNVN